jgi:hypothetical protein
MLSLLRVPPVLTEARAGSNAKAKRDLAWQPKHASWRQGFVEALSNGSWPRPG